MTPLTRIRTRQGIGQGAGLLSCLLWIMVAPAQAATFCVGTASELDNALSTAQNNGQDDQIRLRAGTYATSGAPFQHVLEDGFDITISGGWSDFNSNPCLLNQGKPADTVLDADGNGGVLELNGSAGDTGEVIVRNLSIVGAQVDQFSSGLYIYAANPQFSARILIDRVRFSGNVGQQGSALRVLGGRHTTVRNSLFVFNRSDNGQGVANASFTDGRLYFVNNTFMYNDHSVSGSLFAIASGLFINVNSGGNSPQVLVANNLFWDNQTPDSYNSITGSFHIYNNNYDQRRGQADFEAGNLNLAPQLVNPPLDFTPALGSAMVDAGYVEPSPPFPFPKPFLSDWSYGTQDLYRGLQGRVHGKRVDIGAVESPFLVDIFADSFED